MAHEHTHEELAAIAHKAAARFGGKAIRWWKDQRYPKYLYIEGKFVFSDGKPFDTSFRVPLPKQATG
jgi:hypothetical protein